MVLVVGCTLLSVLYEYVAGNESFSLPWANIVLVTLVGGALSWAWGWAATLTVLAVYGGCCGLAGFVDR